MGLERSAAEGAPGTDAPGPVPHDQPLGEPAAADGEAEALPAFSTDDLAAYYQAALAFIDPALSPDAGLQEVVDAASRRQEELQRRPSAESHEGIEQLVEALLFVRRTHARLREAGDGEARDAEPAKLSPPPAAEPAPETQADGPEAAPDAVPTATQVEEPAPPAADDAPKPPQPAPGKPPRPERAARRPSLREVMAHAAHSPPEQELEALKEPGAGPRRVMQRPLQLPEEAAWPLATGLALILWQAWLALFAGWTVTRFFAWPRPAAGYDLGWLAGAGLIALGLAVAVGVALSVRRYRERTGQLSLLVQLSALAVLADIAAWWLAARGDMTLDGPRWTLILLLGVAWLVAALFAWLHDAATARRG